jgi:ABC-type transporter Mla subunit MlaD
MSKQDRVYTRRASEIEQKYDLSLLSKGVSGRQNEQINQLSQTVAQYTATTNARFEEIQTTTDERLNDLETTTDEKLADMQKQIDENVPIVKAMISYDEDTEALTISLLE